MGVGSPGSGDSRAGQGALIAATVLVALPQIPVWGLVALVGLLGGLQWPNQPPPGPLPWSWPALAWLLVNIVAIAVFPMKSQTYGWWLMLLVQGVDAVALVALMVIFSAPLVLVAAVGAVLAVLLLLWFRSRTRAAI